MDRELEKYYVARMEMFSTKGWKDFIEDVTAMHNARNDIHSLTTGDHLQFAKGELAMMEWIIAIEDISRAAYDKLLEDDQ
jgi:hypothetical protein